MPLIYLAAMLPRSVRQSRLGYLPVSCVIGSRMQGDEVNGLVLDVIMLPSQQFQRMQGYLALQQLMPAPLTAGAPAYVYHVRDVKEYVVEEGEQIPEYAARRYFTKLFALTKAAPEEDLSREDIVEIESAFNRMIKNRGQSS